MKLMLMGVSVIVAIVMTIVLYTVASAESAPGVRIVLVQAAGTDAKFERIDIENLSEQSINLTDWRLLYKTASGNSSPTVLVDFSAPINWHVFLDAGEKETLLSKEAVASQPVNSTLVAAVQFTGGLSTTGGSVQLVDGSGVVVDMVGWGTAAESVRQGVAAPGLTTSTWLVRHDQSGNNAADFSLEVQNTSLYPPVIGSLYEVQDICANISGLQREVSEGYQFVDGECLPIDTCLNIDGVQFEVPDSMEHVSPGECLPIDVCLNLEGIQVALPELYELFGERNCVELIPARQLRITELLPNPSGSDTGNEFIEFYNADSEPVELRNYKLAIGDRSYPLPERTIQPGQYMTISDVDLGGSLPNTTGLPVWLLTIHDMEVVSVPAYANARDDTSWIFAEGAWRYTYVPTPGGENVLLVAAPCQVGYVRDTDTGRCRKVDAVSDSVPMLCREGQYRSEETGRCRNVAVVASLTPCKEGQYRSEETNRCRSFATLTTSVLKPCAEDQFRNPLTNRCKSIASSEDVALADCGEGRERNPLTNRCRNAVAVSAPAMAFPVESVQDTAAAFAGWWVLGGIGVLALGYAGWEWRREVIAMIARIRTAFSSK